MTSATTFFRKGGAAQRGDTPGDPPATAVPGGPGRDTDFLRRTDGKAPAAVVVGATLHSTDVLLNPGLSAFRDLAGARYGAVPALDEARAVVSTAISNLVLPAKQGAERLLFNLVRAGESMYICTDQFHNAEHALNVAAYHLYFLTPPDGRLSVRRAARALLRGLFHDLGNGTTPDLTQPGGDERRSAIALLEQTNLASADRSLAPEMKLALFTSSGRNRFTGCERLLDAAAILGTVFPDRFSAPEQLADRHYVKAFCHELRQRASELQISDRDIAAAARYLRLKPTPEGYSIQTGLEQVVAAAMCSREAQALKHADMAPSTADCDAVKAALLNFWEDRHKPWVQSITSAPAYTAGFKGFVSGEAHARACLAKQAAEELCTAPFARAMQFKYERELSPDLTSVRSPADQQRLCEGLAALGADLQVAQAVAAFTRSSGWRPSIFSGVSDEVEEFGRRRVAALDRFIEALKRPEGQSVTLVMRLVKDDKAIELGSMPLSELVDRMRRKLSELAQSEAASDREFARGFSWSRAPLLQNLPEALGRTSIASLTGRKVAQIFMPEFASSLPIDAKLLDFAP